MYDNKVDVWSAGVIFAEILLRKPLLQGKNYMHQLKLIVRLLGSPSEEELSCLVSEWVGRRWCGWRGGVVWCGNMIGWGVRVMSALASQRRVANAVEHTGSSDVHRAITHLPSTFCQSPHVHARTHMHTHSQHTTHSLAHTHTH